MISAVRSYARARLTALGFKEWTEAFYQDNIPETILDKQFHVTYGTLRAGEVDQNVQWCEIPFTVRIFRKGFNRAGAAVDDAAEDCDRAIAAFLKASNRLSASGGIRTVKLSQAAIEQLAPDNNNSLIIRVEFIASGVISTQ